LAKVGVREGQSSDRFAGDGEDNARRLDFLLRVRSASKTVENEIYRYSRHIFRNSEPEFGWNVREKALTASQHLRERLKKQMSKDRDEPSDTVRSTLIPECVYDLKRSAVVVALAELIQFLASLMQEYITGVRVFRHSRHTFLARMMKASHINPLKWLPDGHDHLSEIQNSYKQEALKFLKDSKDYFNREAEHIAAQRLEEERVIANIIGLTVFICVHFSKGDNKFNEPSLL
jgi:hypothetical protein